MNPPSRLLKFNNDKMIKNVHLVAILFFFSDGKLITKLAQVILTCVFADQIYFSLKTS